MPELPEVETIRRGLAERVIGDCIESVWLSGAPQTFKSPPDEIARVLEGARIQDVRRMGKHIVIDLEKRSARSSVAQASSLASPAGRSSKLVSGSSVRSARKSTFRSTTDDAPTGQEPGATAQWIVHLGMTGSLQITAADTEQRKHTHLIAQLASGRELRFVDPRRFGRIWVTSGFETCGLEPLLASSDEFAALFRKRNTPIKSALLNQKLLRGKGNIYADESLFRAGVRPRRRAGSLTRDELTRLHGTVQQVLTEAIAAGGSSVSDYFDVEGEPGLFQMQHRVYGREGKPCLVCGTPIKRIVVAGRGTHYCPKCQK
jgi:formamidopyrimidine-DNA glycosylase